MKKIDILLCMLFVTTLLLLLTIQITSEANKSYEKCKMYDELWNRTETKPNGYYAYKNYKSNNNEFYCIWTKGRSEEEIISTEEHEKCHVSIDKKPNHFCERERVKL